MKLVGHIKSAGPDRQRGQALIFTAVVMLVMMLALLTMVSMGQLTTEKMRLQNTADSAAYSAAVAQARDYNFSAYMNRGMIANDVAVAQLVGLASWSRNYYDTFHELTKRADTRYSWLLPGPLYPLWTGSSSVAKAASTGLKPAFENAARLFVPLLLGVNEALMVGQKIYHFGTALTVAQTLGVDDAVAELSSRHLGVDFDLNELLDVIGLGSTSVVRANDSHARLSVLGVAAYVKNTIEWVNFTSVRNPLGPWGTETKDDSYETEECRWWSWFGSCAGGSYTKYHSVIAEKKHPAKPDDDGPKKDRMSGVVIASLDEFSTDRSKDWWMPMLVDPTVLIGPKGPSWFMKMLFHDGKTKLADDLEVSGSKSGGYKKDDSWNHRWEAEDSTNMLGLGTIPICGIPFVGCINIPAVVALSGGPAFPLGEDASGKASAGFKTGEWSPTKTALRKYRDVADIEQATATKHTNLTSPPLVVEVEKGSDLVNNTGCGGSVQNAPKIAAAFGAGNLKLHDGSAENCMRALAKAQAYFSRPTDLFPREDNKTEYGSLYSPYWQARLMPNSTAEQAASLISQGLNGFRGFGSGSTAEATAFFR